LVVPVKVTVVPFLSLVRSRVLPAGTLMAEIVIAVQEETAKSLHQLRSWGTEVKEPTAGDLVVGGNSTAGRTLDEIVRGRSVNARGGKRKERGDGGEHLRADSNWEKERKGKVLMSVRLVHTTLLSSIDGPTELERRLARAAACIGVSCVSSHGVCSEVESLRRHRQGNRDE
jgi:hypothetical protein